MFRNTLILFLLLQSSFFASRVAYSLPLLTPVTRNQDKKEQTFSVSNLEAHHQEIILLNFSADGSLLASADSQAIVIWSLATGEAQHILSGHYSPKSQMVVAPTALSFSPDGRFLASSTWSQSSLTPEKSVIVWDTATGEEIFSLNNTGCRQVLFNSNGEKLYLACDSGIQVWQLENREKIANFNEEQPVEAITLSKDGQIMAAADANSLNKQEEGSNRIQLWQLTNDDAQPIATLAGHNNDIAQLTFIDRDKKLVSSSYDGEIKVWNWRQEKEEKTLTQTSKNGLFSASPSGRLIAGNFPRGKVLNLPRGAILETPIFVPFKGKASAVTFNADGNQLAWATNADNFPNPTIVVWKLRGKIEGDNSSDTVRNNYRPLVLNKVWGNFSPKKMPSIGNDPQQIAISVLGLREKVAKETEVVEVTYPQENKAVVTIGQTNLADDSIAGIRYRVEFAPYGSISEDQQWRVIWAGEQYKCQSHRGHQDWSLDLCQMRYAQGLGCRG